MKNIIKLITVALLLVMNVDFVKGQGLYDENPDLWINEGIYDIDQAMRDSWDSDYSNYVFSTPGRDGNWDYTFNEWQINMGQSYTKFLIGESYYNHGNLTIPTSEGNLDLRTILDGARWEGINRPIGFTYGNNDFRHMDDEYRFDVYSVRYSDEHFYIFAVDWHDLTPVVLYAKMADIYSLPHSYIMKHTANYDLPILWSDFVNTWFPKNEYNRAGQVYSARSSIAAKNQSLSEQETSVNSGTQQIYHGDYSLKLHHLIEYIEGRNPDYDISESGFLAPVDRQRFCSAYEWYDYAANICSNIGTTPRAQWEVAQEYGRQHPWVTSTEALQITFDPYYWKDIPNEMRPEYARE